MSDLDLTHDQLIDETKSSIDTLKRNVRAARIIALQCDRPTCRYDHTLGALAEIEAEMRWLVEASIEREHELQEFGLY